MLEEGVHHDIVEIELLDLAAFGIDQEGVEIVFHRRTDVHIKLGLHQEAVFLCHLIGSDIVLHQNIAVTQRNAKILGLTCHVRGQHIGGYQIERCIIYSNTAFHSFGDIVIANLANRRNCTQLIPIKGVSNSAVISNAVDLTVKADQILLCPSGSQVCIVVIGNSSEFSTGNGVVLEILLDVDVSTGGFVNRYSRSGRGNLKPIGLPLFHHVNTVFDRSRVGTGLGFGLR